MADKQIEKAADVWAQLPESERARLLALFAEITQNYRNIGIIWP